MDIAVQIACTPVQKRRIKSFSGDIVMWVTSVNAKKELLATSLLAIALAVGLGTFSFGLFWDSS